VVKSTASGIHPARRFSLAGAWPPVRGGDKRSDGSYLTENTLKEWLGGMNRQMTGAVCGHAVRFAGSHRAETIPAPKSSRTWWARSTAMRKMLETNSPGRPGAVVGHRDKVAENGRRKRVAEAKKGLSAFSGIKGRARQRKKKTRWRAERGT
jgi:hypothetical protein